MSAEKLREAAALMRSRAAHPDVPPQRWEMYEEHWRDYTDEGMSEVGVKALGVPVAFTATPGGEDNDDPQAVAEHIASWHPAVALAVAELLSFAAETWDEDDECRWPVGPDESCGECEYCDHRWTRQRLLAVATAYLGEQR